MTIDIAVLLSIGRHPSSGRAYRAGGDARALEMALRLGPAARIHAIHAGDPEEPALADYLGMGLESLTVLRQPPGADILAALMGHLRSLKLGVVLAGSASEQGESSGMLPYALARTLGLNLAPAIVSIAATADGIDALQALPRGRRRNLFVPLPSLFTVDRAAPAPRQSAYGRARQGRIIALDCPDGPLPPVDGREIPARAKPRRLKIMTGATAAERLRAATEMQAGRGKLMVDPPPEAAARAIYDFLRAEGIIGPINTAVTD